MYPIQILVGDCLSEGIQFKYWLENGYQEIPKFKSWLDTDYWDVPNSNPHWRLADERYLIQILDGY
jgi:hypothetical protein